MLEETVRDENRNFVKKIYNTYEFKKGNIPWNKGLTKELDERLKHSGLKGSKTRKRLYKEGKIKKVVKRGQHLSPSTEFKKGHKGYISKPWLGKKQSEETKDKRRISCKEWWQNPENKNKVKRLKGPEHPLWKGGISGETWKKRKTDKYKKWRGEVYRRDNWACQNCNRKLKRLVAHHIKPVEKFPELIHDIDNGITLCRSCHKIIHKEIGLKTRFQSKVGSGVSDVQ